MELFAIGICALCAVLFAALVQKTNKEYALLISLGTAAVLLLFLLERAGPVLQQVEDLAASGPLEGEAVGLMLRAVGITVVGIPPVWKVRIVSCVPGSPMDCAAMIPTDSPIRTYLPDAMLAP